MWCSEVFDRMDTNGAAVLPIARNARSVLCCAGDGVISKQEWEAACVSPRSEPVVEGVVAVQVALGGGCAEHWHSVCSAVWQVCAAPTHHHPARQFQAPSRRSRRWQPHQSKQHPGDSTLCSGAGCRYMSLLPAAALLPPQMVRELYQHWSDRRGGGWTDPR